MIKEMVTEEFLAELSSKKPTPGGGGAAALGGATGVSLGQMVINLTLGKKKYADVEEEMKDLNGQLEALKAEFLHLADEDAQCVFHLLIDRVGRCGPTLHHLIRISIQFFGLLPVFHGFRIDPHVHDRTG